VSFKGPFAELHKGREKLREIEGGKFAAQARELAGDAVFAAAVSGWRSGVSPYGERWTGAHGRPLSLFKTGSLFRSMKLVRSPLGFKIAVEGPDFGRHSLATIQEYGGFIVAGRGQLLAIRTRRAREAAKRSGFGSDVKPMTFRTPGGGWRSKYMVGIHSNPMLPKATTEIPPRWSKAIEVAIQELGERKLGER
jgi:hypothetical protein